MKNMVWLAILLMLIAGCSTVQDSPSGPTINTTNTTNMISGTEELLLNEQDLAQLGMNTSDGSDCRTEGYETSASSSLAQYSICSYVIGSLNGTEVIIELKKYADLEDLNGSYQYESQHYRSIKGLISENDYGDQSRFYLNNKEDYGGEFTDPAVSYYALYICKDEYLIHITTKGSKEADEYVAKIGRTILSKFG